MMNEHKRQQAAFSSFTLYSALCILSLLLVFLALPAAAQDNAPTLMPAPGDAIQFEMAEAIIVTPDTPLDEIRAALDAIGETPLAAVVLTSGDAPFNFESFMTALSAIAQLEPGAIQIENRLNEGRLSPELYVGLMRQAFSVIKRVNTETLVLAGTLVGGVEGDNCGGRACSAESYRRALTDAGLARFADCIGVRFDASSPLAAVNLAQSFNPYAETFPDKPICLTLVDPANPADLLRAARSNGRVRLLIIETTATPE